MRFADLPLINAALNLSALMCLIAGFVMIRRKRVEAHKRCMLGAFGLSVLFLASYLTYAILGQEKRFGGVGWIRHVYFTILITHVTLAATVPFLATWTLYLGLRGRFDRHRRVARWTFPIWVYVSITGVVVYVMLFVVYGPKPS